MLFDLLHVALNNTFNEFGLFSKFISVIFSLKLILLKKITYIQEIVKNNDKIVAYN